VTKTQLATIRYHATFELDESEMWIAQIEEIPQVHTFGRTLGKAREYLVDALALWLDVPAVKVKDSIDIRPVKMPTSVQVLIDEAVSARVVAESATSFASEIMTAAAVALTEGARLSLRDAADLLGISHQRVQQLVARGSGDLTPIGSGPQGIAQDVARSLKEFLPGGSKEDLGALIAGVTAGVAILWAQSRE
jgi:predicted RNase H-like HicB family nuclease